jgi:predicted nuclease of predicted toxin-antitoxin system
MKLQFDMNISTNETIEYLKQSGHTVEKTTDWGNGRQLDHEILSRAHENGQVVVTKDKDFGMHAIRGGQPHSGIIRVDERVAKEEQGQRIDDLTRNHQRALSDGGIATIEPGRTRVVTAQGEKLNQDYQARRPDNSISQQTPPPHLSDKGPTLASPASSPNKGGLRLSEDQPKVGPPQPSPSTPDKSGKLQFSENQSPQQDRNIKSQETPPTPERKLSFYEDGPAKKPDAPAPDKQKKGGLQFSEDSPAKKPDVVAPDKQKKSGLQFYEDQNPTQDPNIKR